MNFEYKKKFGQNFLTDKNLLEKIVSSAEVTSNDTVIEIGAGKGALTEVLSKYAKKVISFEVDKDLIDFLTDKFDGTNVTMVFDDVMNYSAEKISELASGDFKLVANLPYYVTSPILTRFLKMQNLVSATVMVQDEVADRIVAQPKTKAYGVLTIMCQSFGEAKKCFKVGRAMFTPAPNVDSAVVHITRNAVAEDLTEFFEFVKSAFAMRRKKMSANLEAKGENKAETERLLEKLGHSPLVRAEELSINELKEIYNQIKQKNAK